MKKITYSAAAVTILGAGVGLAAGATGTCTLVSKQEVTITMYCQYDTEAEASSAAEDEWGVDRPVVINTSNDDYKTPPNNPPNLPQESGTSKIVISCHWADDDTITRSGKESDWKTKAGYPKSDSGDGIDDPDNHSLGKMPSSNKTAHVYTFTVVTVYAWEAK